MGIRVFLSPKAFIQSTAHDPNYNSVASKRESIVGVAWLEKKACHRSDLPQAGFFNRSSPFSVNESNTRTTHPHYLKKNKRDLPSRSRGKRSWQTYENRNVPPSWGDRFPNMAPAPGPLPVPYPLFLSSCPMGPQRHSHCFAMLARTRVFQ